MLACHGIRPCAPRNPRWYAVCQCRTCRTAAMYERRSIGTGPQASSYVRLGAPGLGAQDSLMISDHTTAHPRFWSLPHHCLTTSRWDPRRPPPGCKRRRPAGRQDERRRSSCRGYLGCRQQNWASFQTPVPIEKSVSKSRYSVRRAPQPQAPPQQARKSDRE